MIAFPRRASRLTGAVAAALLAALASVPLAAQAPTAPASGKDAKSLISINPLGLPFEYLSAEAEHRVSSLVSIGGSVSYINDLFGATYGSFDAKVRVYPNEQGFKGLSLGMSVGITRVSEDIYDDAVQGNRELAKGAPSIGVLVDYNWLLGKSQRVLIGTGIGAKRVFIDGDTDFDDANVAYPTLRFQIGVIF